MINSWSVVLIKGWVEYVINKTDKDKSNINSSMNTSDYKMQVLLDNT